MAAALAAGASMTGALTRSGFARYAAGDFRSAAEIFKSVAEIAREQPLAWNNLGLALTAMGRHEPAAAVLGRSLALDAAQPQIWTSLAQALLQLGRLDEAEAACGQAIALDRHAAAPWQIRALVRVERDDFAGAAAAFAKTIEISGKTSPLLASLGTMLFRCGRFHSAAETLAEASVLDGSAAETRTLDRLANFVVAMLDRAMPDGAMPDGRSEPAPVEDGDGPADLDVLFKTALLYLDRFGHREAAARTAELWVARCPGNSEARHLMNAALSRPVDRMPAELVACHFDAYAATFDDHLTRDLGYEVPQRIGALLSTHLPAEGGLAILDAGCGTGLCAPYLRPYARHLAGVDLAPRMIDKARARDLYDTLETADLLTALEQPHRRWDGIVAADVLAYFGALEPVFDAVIGALTPGGWFAFTTEAADSDGYVLRGSGRYAHGRAYVTRLAGNRFRIVEARQAEMRREGGRPVSGELYLLEAL